MGIRQLSPGSAWNEAERRAIPFGFAGFFVAGLICVFGHDPGIREPFLAGICGAIGFFLGEMSFAIAFYRKKASIGLAAAILIGILPTAVTASLLPWIGNGVSAFVPSIAAGIGVYVLLHRIHRARSGITLITYLSQLADDEHGLPKPGWQRQLFWLFVGIGAATVFALLAKK